LFSKKSKLIDPEKNYLINNTIFNTDTIKFVSQPLESASNSYVAMVNGKGELSKLNFFIKYSILDKEIRDNSRDGKLINPEIKLENECYFYKLMNKIIQNNISPHLIRGYECMLVSNKSIIPKGKNKTIKNTKIKSKIENRIYIQITEGSTTETYKSLRNFLEEKDLLSNPNTELKIYIILFQIIYTLYVLSEYGIQHTDLHIGNVMLYFYNKIYKNFNKIQELDYNIYKIDDDKYKIPYIGITSKIYDFDNSYRNNTGKLINKTNDIKNITNLQGRYLKGVQDSYGVSPKYKSLQIYNPYFDLYQIILQSFVSITKLLNPTENINQIIDNIYNNLIKKIFLIDEKYYKSYDENTTGIKIITDEIRNIKSIYSMSNDYQFYPNKLTKEKIEGETQYNFKYDNKLEKKYDNIIVKQKLLLNHKEILDILLELINNIITTRTKTLKGEPLNIYTSPKSDESQVGGKSKKSKKSKK
jgi:hypothetical protein